MEEKMNLIEWFRNFHFDLYIKMSNCDHGYVSDDYRVISSGQGVYYSNPYHEEGSVWVHTMMVYKLCKTNVERVIALLHDIGKVYTRDVDDSGKRTRVFFKNHEKVSSMYAIDLLLELVKLGYIKESDMLPIIKVINFHQLLVKDEKTLRLVEKNMTQEELDLLHNFTIYDSQGRISSGDGFFPPRLISQEVEYDEGKPTTTILIGLPASGKSSLCKEILKENPDTVVISRDEYVMKHGTGETYVDRWNSLSNEQQKQIDKELLKDYNRYCREGYDIIIDEVNVSRKERRIFKRDDRNIKYLFRLVGLKEQKEMNEYRYGKVIPQCDVDKMISKFDMLCDY
jgi:hypothetical protein